MCGICGWAGWRASPDAMRGDLDAMCHAIRHRGPDEDGQYLGADVALGMRRLSIIDVAGGRQPITNEDGSVIVVFNGEIYNHHELREELMRRGHRFATKSDTEVIVHLYEECAEACVDRLRGMFTIAIWDSRREQLLLARDRIGIKPLYYWPMDRGVGFGSELRSYLAHSTASPRIDRAAMNAFLTFGYVPDPACIFAGVRKLEPGCRLRWDREDGIRVERYWHVARPEQEIGDEEAIHELRRLLRQAVESHLESEVPLGAFLSGGIDSSTVVALMARASAHRVRTFSIGFDHPEYNEAPGAREVARALGTQHTELVVRPDADRLVEGLIRAFDEPFADSSALPTYLVAQLARTEVTVALSGDGGDELFGGYTRYLETLQARGLPRMARSAGRRLGRSLPHWTPWRNRIVDLARTPWGRYAATLALSPHAQEGGLLRHPEAGPAPLDALLEPWWRGAEDRDFLTQMTIVDLQSFLPGDILTKVDRTSMAVSLEARVPLLDHEVVEFAVSLPSRLKVRDGVGKWILRKAIEDLVPPAVLTKPKQGFAVPLGEWFRTDLRHRVQQLLAPDSPIYDHVLERPVRRLVREHTVGRRDHSPLLWRLLVLGTWLRALHEGTLAEPTENPFRSLQPRASATVPTAQ